MEVRPRGYTLIELLVYMALAIIISLVALSLFRLLQPMMVKTQFSYLVSRDVEQAIEILRSEIRETAVAAIRAYSPEAGGASGLSLPSARDSNKKLVVSEFGVPAWQRQVFWVLTPGPASATVGNLVRWEQPQVSDLPPVAAVAPFPVGGAERVILNNVVLPNVDLQGVGSQGSLRSDADGGFRLRYVRCQADATGVYSYSLSNVNPAQVSQGSVTGLTADGNTSLVEVRLQVYQTSSQGKQDFLSLSFRVRPTY